jgi:hypothetical protein
MSAWKNHVFGVFPTMKLLRQPFLFSSVLSFWHGAFAHLGPVIKGNVLL